MNNSKAVTLIFEASSGCQMNCTGCYIDKTSTHFPTRQEQEEIDFFLDDVVAAGYFLDEVELGPTDLLTTNNRKEFFSEYTKKLVPRFNLAAFQVSLVHPENIVREFVNDLNKVVDSSCKINITTPIEYKHVFNEKYIDRIKTNSEIIKQTTTANVDEVVLLMIFDHSVLTNVGSKYNYGELFRRVRELSFSADTMVDFVFHHGRRKLSAQDVSKDFLKSFKEVSGFFEKDFTAANGQSTINKIPYQLVIQEDRPVEVVWKAGKLFLRPILNEGFVVEDDCFEIQKPWNAENYQIALMDAHERNLSYALTLDDCLSCNNINLCADRMMHDVMRLAGSKECIYLLKNYKPIYLESDSNYISRVEREE